MGEPTGPLTLTADEVLLLRSALYTLETLQILDDERQECGEPALLSNGERRLLNSNTEDLHELVERLWPGIIGRFVT